MPYLLKMLYGMRLIILRGAKMDPVLRAILLSWDLRLDLIIILLVLGTLYTVGWWRLRKRTSRNRTHRQKSGRHELAARWRLVSYLSGSVHSSYLIDVAH